MRATKEEKQALKAVEATPSLSELLADKDLLAKASKDAKATVKCAHFAAIAALYRPRRGKNR
jgi:hypothetical protein